MHRDVEAADRMIAHLSDLLRLVLENPAVQEVPLRRELEFLDRYLAIEKVRFPDRLRVSTDIDAAALDAPVPSLLLQPLVENAVRYSIAPRVSGGEIRIRAARRDSSVRIEVEDDGPGLAPGWTEGVGLTNTRARLAHLYGTAHAFSVGAGELGGTLVQIEVPWRA
jgi:LytS/YehU family sensor histidine kinase